MVSADHKVIEKATWRTPRDVQIALDAEVQRVLADTEGPSELVAIYERCTCFNSRSDALQKLMLPRLANQFGGLWIDLEVHALDGYCSFAYRAARTQAQLSEANAASFGVPIRWLTDEPITPNGRPVL